jgi:hypothetical protein
MDNVVANNIGHYAKSLIYIGLAGVGVLIASLADGKVSDVEFVNVIIAFLGAIPVYWFANKATGVFQYTKTIVAFLVAALSALAVILVNGAGIGGVTVAEWLNVAVVAFAAIGVAVIPNEAAVVVPKEVAVADPAINDKTGR